MPHPLMLTLLPCKQAELSCTRGILVSDICCRSRSQPRTVSGSKTGFDSLSPLVLWRCEASPQPAPAIASHWRNSQTNDCSASYPELSGSTIGRVTRPRMLPLRISPYLMTDMGILSDLAQHCTVYPDVAPAVLRHQAARTLVTERCCSLILLLRQYRRQQSIRASFDKAIISLIKRGVKDYLTIVSLFEEQDSCCRSCNQDDYNT